MMDDIFDLYSLTEDTREDDLGWAFAVADILWHRGADLPKQWEYWHSPLCIGSAQDSYEDSSLYDLKATTEDLLAFGWYLQGKLMAREEK